MLKAILFDLDDTLIDWSGFKGPWDIFEIKHVRPVFDYICGEGHNLADFDGFFGEYMRRIRDAWEGARTTLHAPHLGRILVATATSFGVADGSLQMERYLEHYPWGVVDGTALFPEVREVLSTLRKRGLKMGIVTNAHQPMSMRDSEIAQHGLIDFFPTCRLSAADVGYLKPHPNIFERALRCLGTSPEETLFVGDNPVADIAGAQGAGLRAVLRVKHPPSPLISGLVVPDGAINSLVELPVLLDDLYPGW